MSQYVEFLSTYWLIRHEHGVSRTLGEVEHYSAIPTDYLATGGLFHFKTWSQKFLRTDALFPGVLALFLAGTAVFSRTATRDKVARMLLGICLLYTSDAADDLLCVDLGGRRIIKKK